MPKAEGRGCARGPESPITALAAMYDCVSYTPPARAQAPYKQEYITPVLLVQTHWSRHIHHERTYFAEVHHGFSFSQVPTFSTSRLNEEQGDETAKLKRLLRVVSDDIP